MEKDKEKQAVELGKKVVSLVAGIAFNFIGGSLFSSFIEGKALKLMESSFATIIYWSAFAIFVLYFGWKGIRKIQEFWVGVPVIFGQPVSWFILPSGYFWQLPEPLMSFIPIYIGQRNLEVPEVTALSKDQILIKMKSLVQARVTESYNWARTEDANGALRTLLERNLRILINSYPCFEIPGMKQHFSTKLEEGDPELPVFDKDGNPKKIMMNGIEVEETVELKSVKEEAKMWGFNGGIDKCMVNTISIPEKITSAKAEEQIEQAQSIAETVQQNLLYSLLGGGDIERGKTDWLSMSPEERAKISQAERGKRDVVTVDGNAGDFTKGSVASAAMNRRRKS